MAIFTHRLSQLKMFLRKSPKYLFFRQCKVCYICYIPTGFISATSEICYEVLPKKFVRTTCRARIPLTTSSSSQSAVKAVSSQKRLFILGAENAQSSRL